MASTKRLGNDLSAGTARGSEGYDFHPCTVGLAETDVVTEWRPPCTTKRRCCLKILMSDWVVTYCGR